MRVRGISIDNGGSGLRMLPVDGVLDEVSNDFVEIGRDSFRIKEADDMFGLCDVVSAPKAEYCGIIACGSAGRMYEASKLGYNSQSAKTSSTDYYREFVYALARDAIQEKRRKQFSQGGTDFSGEHAEYDEEPDFSYVLATCIPIKEHSGKLDCATVLKKALAGDYEVTFPLLKDEPRSVTFSLKAENIGVVPEGGVAITALKDEVGEEDISLIVDMGHVTVDLALFKGKTLYGGNVVSSPYAGSTLIALVRGALVDEGFFLNETQVQRVLETNKVKQGNQELDFTDVVNKQRSIYVQNYLKGEVLQLLNMNAINVKQVQNFIPLGAGMNNASAEGSIVRELIGSCGLKAATVKILSKDLRHVNVEQTLVFAKALYRRATR